MIQNYDDYIPDTYWQPIACLLDGVQCGLEEVLQQFEGLGLHLLLLLRLDLFHHQHLSQEVNLILYEEPEVSQKCTLCLCIY
mgnify:CR=1 FL=1